MNPNDGIKLHYVEKGSGFPFILLHGNGENGKYFLNQIAYFSQKYRVIALDTRGHGGSPRGSAPFTIQQFEEDLNRFLEDKGIKKAHILGFSDGGNIALAFAGRHPEKVERLILNGANLEPGGVKASVQFPIIAGYYTASLFARWSGEARKKAELLRLMVKEPHISAKALSAIPAKTLVIVGNRDMIKEKHSRLIAKSLPEGELCIIKGNHFIAASNPSAFNKAVELFLES